MKKYIVTVGRVSYRSAEFEVEANNIKKAKLKAEEMAYDHDYNDSCEDDCVYKISDVSELKDV